MHPFDIFLSTLHFITPHSTLLTHPHIRSFLHSVIHLFPTSYSLLPNHSCTHPTIYPFTHSPIYSSTHLLIHPSTSFLIPTSCFLLTISYFLFPSLYFLIHSTQPSHKPVHQPSHRHQAYKDPLSNTLKPCFLLN